MANMCMQRNVALAIWPLVSWCGPAHRQLEIKRQKIIIINKRSQGYPCFALATHKRSGTSSFKTPNQFEPTATTKTVYKCNVYGGDIVVGRLLSKSVEIVVGCYVVCCIKLQFLCTASYPKKNAYTYISKCIYVYTAHNIILPSCCGKYCAFLFLCALVSSSSFDISYNISSINEMYK